MAADSKKLTSQSEDFPRWYQEIIQRAELAEHAPVKGSMIIRPYGYALWENMQRELDRMFKETGHENAYFPLLIPESFLKKEAEHVEGFAPELAVVTHAGGKDLEENYVIRPTSETIIWNTYKKWISTHKDLPILINQWANVMRWELRTRLFLRTSEFLWQEGHTAHATAEEAREETLKMLEVYRTFAEDFMAVPVLTGRKTARERFAGAVETFCIEALMGDKKALQAGTSHDLGQNFAKAFDVKFANEKQEQEYVWASSWGVSTRLVGAIIMAHGDDAGLVLPPRLAPQQVVIIPIVKADNRASVLEECDKLVAELREHGVRAKVDSSNKKPGHKFAEWELRGVPIRVEVGPRDIESGQVSFKTRHDGEKHTEPRAAFAAAMPKLLEETQAGLLKKAKEFRAANTHRVDSYDEFKDRLDSEGGFFECHWDGTSETEEKVQNETKATIRCIPLDDEKEPGACMVTGQPSERRVVFAKAY